MGNLTSDIPFWGPPENLTQAHDPRPVYTINSATGQLSHESVLCAQQAFDLPALAAMLLQHRAASNRECGERQDPRMGRECLEQIPRGFLLCSNMLTGMFNLMCRHI